MADTFSGPRRAGPWFSNWTRFNSASVLSPRTAARATFALKAAVWFRRGRLVIVSPGLQPFWLLSGRNSTYPAVQISRASSKAGVVEDPGGDRAMAGQCRQHLL